MQLGDPVSSTSDKSLRRWPPFRSAAVGVLVLALGSIALWNESHRADSDPSTNPNSRSDATPRSGAVVPGNPFSNSIEGSQDAGQSPRQHEHWSRLEPRQRELFLKEVEIRAELLGVIEASGPEAAFETALAWLNPEGGTTLELLRELVAIRALSGLAQEISSPNRIEETLGILLKYLDDPAAGSARRSEAFDGMLGRPFCQERGGKSMSRLNKSCRRHSFSTDWPGCPHDLTTQGNLAEQLGPDVRIIDVLDRLARKQFGLDADADLDMGSPLAELADLDPARASDLIVGRIVELEEGEAHVPAAWEERTRTYGRASYTIAETCDTVQPVLEDCLPDNPAFQHVLRIGASTPSLQVRLGIMGAIESTTDTWGKRHVDVPGLAEFLGGMVEYTSNVLDVDAESRDTLVSGELNLFLWLWGRRKFSPEGEDDVDPVEYVTRVESQQHAALPAYRRAVESLLAAPGSEIPEPWLHHLKFVDYEEEYPWEVDGVSVPRSPGLVLGQHLIEILRGYPDSVRARAMLAVAETVAAEEANRK